MARLPLGVLAWALACCCARARASFYQCSVQALDAATCPGAMSDAAIAQGFCVKTFNNDLKKPRGIEVRTPARPRP